MQDMHNSGMGCRTCITTRAAEGLSLGIAASQRPLKSCCSREPRMAVKVSRRVTKLLSPPTLSFRIAGGSPSSLAVPPHQATTHHHRDMVRHAPTSCTHHTSEAHCLWPGSSTPPWLSSAAFPSPVGLPWRPPGGSEAPPTPDQSEDICVGYNSYEDARAGS